MAKNVTPRQRRAIESLLTTADNTAAAAAAGVSRQTLYRWLRDPVFQAELDRVTGEAIDALSRAMVRLGKKATIALDDAIGSNDLPVRVRASNIVMARLLQLRELAAMEWRLSEIERKLQDSE